VKNTWENFIAFSHNQPCNVVVGHFDGDKKSTAVSPNILPNHSKRGWVWNYNNPFGESEQR